MLILGDINLGKASGHQEDNPLRDIGGPGSDAFQVMSCPQEVGGALNERGPESCR